MFHIFSFGNFSLTFFNFRQLIFYVPDIIASPVFGSYSNIHIITTVQYYESGKLSQYLEKLRLTVSNF